ncbi:AfsR/SARP family transcriptional regulator [Actinophytocola sp.]|uniref:AfsR/SARP family transcriptional regulator n=1 Tax=Actinophytocola sp. TaxID=1872138 RepID=UPI002EDB3534
MDSRILGPVRVLNGDRPVPVPTGQLGTLLTVLLLRANQVVTIQELTDYLWDEAPPERPRAAIQTYLGRLRRVLGDGQASIRTVPGGYVLDLDPMELDLGRFRRWVRQASDTADPDAQVGLLTRALELWQGQPLGDVEGLLKRDQVSLVEERLYALEQLINAQLKLGRQGQVVAQLTTLTKEYPLRESFWALLMVALYRSGRVADALHAYRTLARTLADELGMDPSDDLKQLHQQLLSADPRLSPSTEPPARNYLPRDLPDFTGRRRELDVLTSMPAGGAVSITAIDGMAGVGKTALAVHAAHQLAAGYPDGQLFLDLHGYSSDRPPAEPAAALDALLRLLGVSGERIPRHLEERAALWRAELADRKVLLVLDNVVHVRQVTPLLPAGQGCLVLITSRRRLAELDAVESLTLDVLPPDDAAELFTRTAARSEDVAAVTALCGYLPLAIRMVAGRLRHRPAWSVEDLVRRLSDERYRLAELAVGESSVASAFQVSYRQLNPEQQRLFRLLGLHPGPDIDRHAAAALADRAVRDTERLLEDLVDVHLLIQDRAFRYRFHDLIRWHAHRLAGDDQDSALTRLLDHYLNTALLANELQYPERRRVQDGVVTGWTPPLGRPTEALDWFDTEYDNIAALIAHAAEHGKPGHAWRLSFSVWDASLRYTDIDATVALNRVALDAARSAGDQRGEAMVLINLGSAAELSGELIPAVDYLQAAAEQFRGVGDQYGEGAALANLGYVLSCLGHNESALENYERTSSIMRSIGHRRGIANSTCDIADHLRRLGRLEEALPLFAESLAIHVELGNGWDEADTRRKMAVALYHDGRFADSVTQATRAMNLFRENEDPLGEAYAANRVGLASRALGLLGEAERWQRHALALFYGLNAEHSAELRNDRGDIHRFLDERDQAMDQYRAGLVIARRTNALLQEARACEGIAHLSPDPDGARQHWRRALEIYLELEVPDAARISALLK